MKLPREVELARKIRRQRRACREAGVYAPRLTGAYDVASRERRARELAAIAAKL